MLPNQRVKQLIRHCLRLGAMKLWTNAVVVCATVLTVDVDPRTVGEGTS